MSITPQEYFDKSVDHLRTQGKQAYDGNSCLYLMPNGLKCVVGSFIPDGHDAQKFPNDFDDLMDEFPDLEGIAWPKDNPDIASILQSIHDSGRHWSDHGFTDSGERRLANLAEDMNLIYTPRTD